MTDIEKRPDLRPAEDDKHRRWPTVLAAVAMGVGAVAEIFESGFSVYGIAFSVMCAIFVVRAFFSDDGSTLPSSATSKVDLATLGRTGRLPLHDEFGGPIERSAALVRLRMELDRWDSTEEFKSPEYWMVVVATIAITIYTAFSFITEGYPLWILAITLLPALLVIPTAAVLTTRRSRRVVAGLNEQIAEVEELPKGTMVEGLTAKVVTAEVTEGEIDSPATPESGS